MTGEEAPPLDPDTESTIVNLCIIGMTVATVGNGFWLVLPYWPLAWVGIGVGSVVTCLTLARAMWLKGRSATWGLAGLLGPIGFGSILILMGGTCGVCARPKRWRLGRCPACEPVV